ncbi:hypothetical protein HAT2_00333 [Candidatus Similichlamydia laticola]|uniref:Uncharacterized protein n=1 Tax=Candidatus Similichlamydia laticola TaxID=2170265 RepID=A0A369KDJ4_9BACT|nr:hypothetical protein HAT2_00333 [Candidatus Similichlamydia laticola]
MLSAPNCSKSIPLGFNSVEKSFLYSSELSLTPSRCPLFCPNRTGEETRSNATHPNLKKIERLLIDISFSRKPLQRFCRGF